PPRRLPAAERGHARLHARRAGTAGTTGGCASQEAVARWLRGTVAAVGSLRTVPGADPASGGAAAPGPQCRAHSRPEGGGPPAHHRTAPAPPRVPRAAADRGGPGGRDPAPACAGSASAGARRLRRRRSAPVALQL